MLKSGESVTTRPREASRERERLQRIVLLSLVGFVQVVWVVALVYLVLHFL